MISPDPAWPEVPMRLDLDLQHWKNKRMKITWPIYSTERRYGTRRKRYCAAFPTSESLETIFGGLKYLNSLRRIRDGKHLDPWWKKFGSGNNIPDPQHWKEGAWPEVLELALWWVSGTTGVPSHHVVLLVTWDVVRGIAARWLVLLVFLRLQRR
jgi:hypothetical protein